MAENEQDNIEDKPLDPAVERVRAKLVRFMIINLAILFIALIAVVAAIVYRKSTVPQAPSVTPSELPALPAGEALLQEIALPTGARIIHHALAGDRLSVHLVLANGGQAILLYDIAAGNIVARFEARPAP